MLSSRETSWASRVHRALGSPSSSWERSWRPFRGRARRPQALEANRSNWSNWSNRGNRTTGLLVAALVPILAIGATSCAARSKPAKAPRPSAYRVEIQGLREVGPYLQADLSGRGVARDGSARRFYFPPSAACRSALASPGEVQYRPEGSFGRLKSPEGHRCSPSGLGSLDAWRDHRGVLRHQPLPDRVQAEYVPLAATDDQLLVRGRFPLTLELRWPEPMDTVAMLPVSEVCQAIFDVREATMEYRTQGDGVFWLESDAGRCPIVGLAVPLPPETP